MTTSFNFVLALLLVAAPLAAAPVPYALDAANSTVGFEVGFGPDRIKGSIPVVSADIALDLDRVGNSRVDVVLDVAHAQASFPFATQALRGAKVLDAADFPSMTFRSTGVTLRGSEVADVAGDLTMRGQTRPVVLTAQLFRQRGTEAGDRSRLVLLVNGLIRRSEFGASGWNDMVGDEVEVKMSVRMDRAP
jgi:polyisoprenoid-binding protein YceI